MTHHVWDAVMTHHSWWDVPYQEGQRLAVAICGLIIDRTTSVPDPTCPICREILAEHDRTDPELEETPS